MIPLNRRSFLVSSSALAFTRLSEAQASQPQASAPPADVTRSLARYVVSARLQDLPASVRHEASRTLVNYIGCALGGSHHETVDVAIAALSPFSGPAQATVLGRKERLDILHASLMNGISSHVLDYDDTHLRTIIHPGGPVISAILALSEMRPVSGAEFVNAIVVGVEVACRIGNAVYPQHYTTGWHITGTTGVFGAAAASGKLLGLTEQQMLYALGLAATQPVGLQEMFGTMTKSFHPGRAAQNGLTSALMAQRNYTSSLQSLEARYGWGNVVSTARNYSEITSKLGSTWEIAVNTYKPFACGIVMHPTIDGCVQLRNEHKLTAAAIDRVELRVHPLVLELTGKKTPATGLESKFSIYHAAAVAIVEGGGGVAQFSDRAAKLADVITIRDRVTATVDPAIKEEQVRIAVHMKDGRRLDKFIEHALGSTGHPLTDKDLEAKFQGLANGVLSNDRIRALMDLCWKIESAPQASAIARAAAL
jgi:2-methylcitrate dehydratase PrpD